jgi:hypothetical protein
MTERPDDLVYITKDQKAKLEADVAACQDSVRLMLAQIEDGHGTPELEENLRAMQGLVDELDKMLRGAMPFPEAN